MSDIVVKDHIYNFMKSQNVVEAQHSINTVDKSELTQIETKVDNLELDYDINKPKWDNTSTLVQNNSANWLGASSDNVVIANSANWSNAYTTVQSNSANWSENNFSIYINVKDYGATGNGITNDYPNIRTAFSQLTANGGGVLYFPTGKYILNQAIEIINSDIPILIMGDGEASKIISSVGLSSTNTGNYPMILGSYSSNIEIRNLTLDGIGSLQSIPSSGGIPLYFNRAKNKCFSFQYCKNIKITNSFILNTQTTNEFIVCSSVDVMSTVFKNASYRYPLSGLLGQFTGIYYPDDPGREIYASGASLIGMNTCMDVKFKDCYFENWQYDAIAHTIYDTQPAKNFEVDNCTFYNISSSVFAIECYQANTNPLSGELLRNQKYINNIFINSPHSIYSGGCGISSAAKGVQVSNNTWLDYSLSGTDSWRIGLELNGSDMLISNNIFNNSQLHLNNNIRQYSEEGLVNANIVVMGNILNSNRNTAGGNGTIVINSSPATGNNVKISDNIFTYLSGMSYRGLNISNVSNVIVHNNIFKKTETPNVDDSGIAIEMKNVSDVRITNNNIQNFGIGLSLPPSSPFKSRNFYIKDNLLKNSGASYIGEQNIQYNQLNGLGPNNSIVHYNIQSLSSLSLSSYSSVNINDIFVRMTGVFPRSKFIISSISNPVKLSQTLTYENVVYTLSSFDIIYNASNDFGIGENGTANKFHQYDEESMFGENNLNFSLTAKNVILTENYSTYDVGAISEMIVIKSESYSESSKYLLPKNSIIKSIVANVSLPSDGPTSYNIGNSTSSFRFLSALNNTRNSNSIGFLHIPNNMVQLNDEKIRITPNTTPLSAGAINVTVYYEMFSAPKD